MGIPVWKIDKTYAEISVKSRILFLKRHAELMQKKNISGSVAECGVYRGDFAKEINKYFPERICYLFDTFEGFDSRDFDAEKEKSMITGSEYLGETNIELVKEKMPHIDKVEFKVGYFPDTLGNLEDKFVFVNLDMDLYKPTLEGLRYFYPRMVEGGIILIHDYFSDAYPNIEKAVDDYEEEFGKRLIKTPIGDDISMAVLK
ncbi:MAG: class I SAM-dependent methyltransferase [Selenomonadaceae bacterium]|nr:class I SAM-dependent methyltransferase [Selenomonadaceae bacterium]